MSSIEPPQSRTRKLFRYVSIDYVGKYHELIVEVFKSDLGVHPDDIFESFSHEPLASASIAQVHRAKLAPRPGETEGRVVAVKVQKPAIRKQMDWDLWSYR